MPKLKLVTEQETEIISPYKRESASEIAARLRSGRQMRPIFVSEIDPPGEQGIVIISSIGRVPPGDPL